jgi:hypothetical protein
MILYRGQKSTSLSQYGQESFITLDSVHRGGDRHPDCGDYRGRHQCRGPGNPIQEKGKLNFIIILGL